MPVPEGALGQIGRIAMEASAGRRARISARLNPFPARIMGAFASCWQAGRYGTGPARRIHLRREVGLYLQERACVIDAVTRTDRDGAGGDAALVMILDGCVEAFRRGALSALGTYPPRFREECAPLMRGVPAETRPALIRLDRGGARISGSDLIVLTRLGLVEAEGPRRITRAGRDVVREELTCPRGGLPSILTMLERK